MKTFYEDTIIKSIDFSGYEDDADIYGDYPLYTDIQNIYFIFKKEFVHEYNKHIPERTLFKEWLMGLPSVLGVPFMNHKILTNAKEAGVKVVNEDKFLESYWQNLSDAFFTLKENL